MEDRIFNDLKPSKLDGTRVVAKKGGSNIEHMIQSFRRKVKNSGKIVELKERQEFKKPSLRRREMINQAKRKQYMQRINEDY